MGSTLSCDQRQGSHSKNDGGEQEGEAAEDDTAPSGTPGYCALAGAFCMEHWPMVIWRALDEFECLAYGFMAPTIAEAIFHGSDTVSWLVYAFPELARPVGGYILGYIRDTHGRAVSVFASRILVIGGTFGQAMTPTVPGLGAAWMMVSRLVQGIGYGAATGSTMTYLVESAPTGVIAMSGTTLQYSVCGGTLLSIALMKPLFATLSDRQMQRWGWRDPFVCSALSAGVVIWLTAASIKETRQLEKMKKEKEAERAGSEPTISSIFAGHWRELLLACSGLGCVTASQYLWVTFFRSVLIRQYKVAATKARLLLTGIQIVGLVLCPMVAFLGDCCGVGKAHFLTALYTCAFSIPANALLFHCPTSPVALMVCRLAFPSGLFALTTSVYPWLVELFPTHIRNRAVATCWSVTGLAGGFAPSMCSGMTLPYSVGVCTVVLSAPSLLAAGATLAARSKGTGLEVTHIRHTPY